MRLEKNFVIIEKKKAFEKNKAIKKIAIINKAIELKIQAEWELSIAANQLYLNKNILDQQI